MRGAYRIGLLLGCIVAGALFVGTTFGQSTQTCGVSDTSTKEVLPGLTLTWDSAFLCANAPDSGSYSITVRVANASGSTQAARIDSLRLSHTTPRPRGKSPTATASASGLPLTVGPGGNGSFGVSGTYTLVTTDEGKKANIHLRALGTGVSTGDPFRLGINVMLRGAGATETSSSNGNGNGNGNGGGPPSWAPGPPPWAGGATRNR